MDKKNIWIFVGVGAVVLIIGAFIFTNNKNTNRESSFDDPSTKQVIDETKERASSTTEEVTDTSRELVARAKAKADLLALRTNIKLKTGYEDASTKVEDVQHYLKDAYASSTVSAKEEYSDIETKLSALLESLQQKSSDALFRLDEALEALQGGEGSTTPQD